MVADSEGLCIEKFEPAVNNYFAAMSLKMELLPLSSRQIAEGHYKLCIVYDLTPGRLTHAIEHAQKAEASVQAQLDEITTQLQAASLKDDSQPKAKPDTKGKGKVALTGIASESCVEDMTRAQLESEIKELQGLFEEASLKAGHPSAAGIPKLLHSLPFQGPTFTSQPSPSPLYYK